MQTMEWEGWAVLVVMLISLVLLYSEFRPPDVVLLGALAVVWNLGIVDTKDAIAGFSNSSLITVGALFIVVEGVDKAKLVDKVARKCLGKTSERMALLRLCSLGLAFSGFFNNTPLVALLMPILRDWARSRNFAPSKFLIPLSYSTIGGGLMTIIGTSTNLVVIGMMANSGEEESFGFFDPAKVGGPVSLLALVYLLTLGRRLLPDNRGGMFREVAEHTAEMLTELHFTSEFPLIGNSVWDSLDYLGIPQDSLKKVFRVQQESRENRAARARKLTLEKVAFGSQQCSRQHASDELHKEAECRVIVSLDDDAPAVLPKALNGFSRQVTPDISSRPVVFSKQLSPASDVTERANVALESADMPSVSPSSTRSRGLEDSSRTKRIRSSYRFRTQKCWGGMKTSEVLKSGSGKAVVESSNGAHKEDPTTQVPLGFHGCSPESDAIRQVSYGSSTIPDAIVEIVPVPQQQYEHLVLQGGDTLVLNIPIVECLKLLQSPEISQRLNDLFRKESPPLKVLNETPSPEAPLEAASSMHNSLRIGHVNFLDLPGWKDEFVELVLAASNPFVGREFGRESRQKFEDYYQVAVIALRQHGERMSMAVSPTYDFSTPRDDSPSCGISSKQKDDCITSPTTPHSRASNLAYGVSKAAIDVLGIQQRSKRLKPGDTLLVLAGSGDFAMDRLQTGRDFLTVTRVGHEREGGAHLLDYVPLVLFLAALALVALQVIPMVQASIALAMIFVFGGWVEAKRIRECVDWNLMILIGSALGLSAAVKESGLSAAVASIVKSANLGPWGSVYLLYFFTMLITELVTNNAAAALGYPLAVDLTREMGLKSVKPLVMTVMLAASTSYASPIGYATNLMVLGPGGYSFKDFFKVGLPMDIIYWIGCSTFLPVIWPLEMKE